MPEPVIDPTAGTPPAPQSAPPAAPPPPAPPAAGSPPPAPSPPTAGEAPAPPPAADWRTKLAGGDEKKLKMLERISDENALAKSWFDLKHIVDTTRPKAPLPDKPTPEQLTAWRADNGIPETPTQYLENLPQGLVIGTEDKPLFESFAAALHAKNLPPTAAHAAIEWYNGFAEAEAARVAEADRANAAATEEALRTEWGPDYKANVNVRAAFLESLAPEVKDAFLYARLPDGTLLGEHPYVSKWLVDMAREINPVATIPPGSGIVVGGKTVDDRLNEIRKEMGNERGPYWKGPKGADGKTALESEYDKLVEIKNKQQQRGAA